AGPDAGTDEDGPCERHGSSVAAARPGSIPRSAGWWSGCRPPRRRAETPRPCYEHPMRWRYLVAAALALVTSTALARKVYVRVAGRGRALVIQADINQRVSGPFLLDTGASYCVVTKETA